MGASGRKGTEGRSVGKYDVTIEGGKGAVVGDFATVLQLFAQAPAALSTLTRTDEFRALIEERTRGFVGRNFVFDAIEEGLADSTFPSGYIVIQGEPGIGKTALMGQLVKRGGYAHHFNVSPLGIRSPEAFLSNICAQLIVRYELDHDQVPAGATQDGGFLSRLLTEAADAKRNLPIVVLVDALDEAEDVGLASGANRLFLPPSLPPGVFFVVSMRPEYDYRLFVDSRRDIYLRDDDPRNLDDVREFVREFLEANRLHMGPRIEAWNVPVDEFIEALIAKSEGNFMYLVHVLRDIRDDRITAGTVDAVRNLPQGLRDYYRRHWSDMRGVDPDRFRRYEQPVVCLLATVREPVSLADLISWTRSFWAKSSWNAGDLDPLAVREVFSDWWEFLNASDVGGEDRYRLYHASFADFLRDEVGLAVYDETISETALAKIPGFLEGG